MSWPLATYCRIDVVRSVDAICDWAEAVFERDEFVKKCLLWFHVFGVTRSPLFVAEPCENFSATLRHQMKNPHPVHGPLGSGEPLWSRIQCMAHLGSRPCDVRNVPQSQPKRRNGNVLARHDICYKKQEADRFGVGRSSNCRFLGVNRKPGHGNTRRGRAKRTWGYDHRNT